MIGIKYFEFQEKAVDKLNEFCLLNSNNKKTLIVKAPTGSGKTIILLQFIEKYIYQNNDRVCFIWLTPGSGNLEEQSKKKMDQVLPNFVSKNIDDVLLNGFNDDDVCFINWERVTKKDNRAVTVSERRNLFDRISDAKLNGIKFILIIDEEHQNNTSKASDIIDAFAAKNTIRVSATAQKNRLFEWYEINETDVINSGLITKAIYINDDVNTSVTVKNENELLIKLADEKRELIKKEYIKLKKDINPLVIIQFPNENPKLVSSIESTLKVLNKTYDNGLIGIWMADRKENIDDITNMNSHVQYLLIKQAVATGWDCPRAKILVKLRENMSETFELQTLGRIRRTPESQHYDNDLLDYSFLYTFDEKYKEQVKQNIMSAYEVKRIFLKPQFKNIKLYKQLRNKDFSGLGERDIRDKFYKFFLNKYSLTNDCKKNIQLLENAGYNLSASLDREIAKDKVSLTSDLAHSGFKTASIHIDVNTSIHSIDLMQTIDSFKKLLGLDYSQTRGLLNYFFRKDIINTKFKILKLNLTEFYSFVLNNAHLLREDFREGMIGSKTNVALDLIDIKEEQFKFPSEEIFKYVPNGKDAVIMEKNVYKEYTDECLISGIRSTSEQLFEKWCENNADWYYKNGNSGPKYFCVVYYDGVGKQDSFYADYILMINKEMWIIETKGGEDDYGEDNNIDINVVNKFNAFKEYANNKNIKWGFVRDKRGKLYINNEEYVEDMDNDKWKPIDSILK